MTERSSEEIQRNINDLIQRTFGNVRISKGFLKPGYAVIRFIGEPTTLENYGYALIFASRMYERLYRLQELIALLRYFESIATHDPKSLTSVEDILDYARNFEIDQSKLLRVSAISYSSKGFTDAFGIGYVVEQVKEIGKEAFKAGQIVTMGVRNFNFYKRAKEAEVAGQELNLKQQELELEYKKIELMRDKIKLFEEIRITANSLRLPKDHMNKINTHITGEIESILIDARELDNQKVFDDVEIVEQKPSLLEQDE